MVFTRAGILPEHIALTNICTNCNSDLLFSHRASHGQRGSLAAFLALPVIAKKGDKDVLHTLTDNTAESVTENIQQEVATQTSFAVDFFHENLPKAINFGVGVVFALIFFLIGRILINWVRKLVRPLSSDQPPIRAWSSS